MMQFGWKDSGEQTAPAVTQCRFIATVAGTVVYGPDGRWLGQYETEDAAVEMIRESSRTGGNRNAV